MATSLQAIYGVDTLWPGDVPLISVPVTDPFLVVGQRLRSRLSTERGGLAIIGGDPNGGFNVRRFVLTRVSSARMAQAELQVRDEALKDEAVQSATAKFNYQSSGNLTIGLDCILAIGPLLLTLNVTALTVTAVYTY